MTYGYHILQLGFEDAVEVLGGADGDEGVGVGEGGEDADSVGGDGSVKVLFLVFTLLSSARNICTWNGSGIDSSREGKGFVESLDLCLSFGCGGLTHSSSRTGRGPP